jgi:hypothetical protein
LRGEIEEKINQKRLKKKKQIARKRKMIKFDIKIK